MRKIVMGIDPGFNNTGYGILEIYNDNIKYIKSGTIKFKKEDTFEKLKIIYFNINNIVKEFNPNYCVIEKTFVGKNLESSLKLCMARTVSLISLINLNIPIFEYYYIQVKKYIFNNIFYNKLYINKFIKNYLNITKLNINKDESDALLIAMTHHFNINNKKIFL